ncbi:MAG: SDR family oxidoreductase [Burkholderiales bacterium]|nr:SDR family oxidoreductase [Burkholderiales bacterium]
MKILVTGANGFVGQVLCRRLIDQEFSVKGAVRSEKASLPAGVEKIPVGEIGASTVWKDVLEGVDCVIHLAARVHVMHEERPDPIAEFRKVNVEGTKRLAEAAARSGVKRFVYVSSIKVNGEGTTGAPYTERDLPDPQDPYGISKWEAEEALHEISKNTGLEVAIVRPPLVYGPGVGGNFLRMLRLVEKGIPLPLASIENRRSMIYVENLADALILCATHPDAAGETFLVSDIETVSTPELIRRLSLGMKKRAAILPFPLSLLALLGKISGKSAEIQRLTGSLEVDGSKMRKMLGWKPPRSLDDGLEKTVDWFSKNR